MKAAAAGPLRARNKRSILTLSFRCYQAFKPPAEGKWHSWLCVFVEWGWEEGSGEHMSSLHTIGARDQRKQKFNFSLLQAAWTLNKRRNSRDCCTDETPELERETERSCTHRLHILHFVPVTQRLLKQTNTVIVFLLNQFYAMLLLLRVVPARQWLRIFPFCIYIFENLVLYWNLLIVWLTLWELMSL